jgi:hypothetical protein
MTISDINFPTRRSAMANGIKDVKIVEVDAAEFSRSKQKARDIDAADLASGKISQSELRNRNGFLNGFDFSKAKIVSIGDKNYDEID